MQVRLLEAERLSASGFVPPWVRYEHVARYRFAAQFVENRIVVDCACGTGEGTGHFLQSGASHIYAFDVSELSIEEARQHCRSNSVAFQVAEDLFTLLNERARNLVFRPLWNPDPALVGGHVTDFLLREVGVGLAPGAGRIRGAA